MCQDIKHAGSLVKLENLKIEPVEANDGVIIGARPPIRQTMNGKPISSLEKVLETIETVVLGLDETSRALKGSGHSNPFERLYIFGDQLLDPQMQRAVEALDAVIESKCQFQNGDLDFKRPSPQESPVKAPTIACTSYNIARKSQSN